MKINNINFEFNFASRSAPLIQYAQEFISQNKPFVFYSQDKLFEIFVPE